MKLVHNWKAGPGQPFKDQPELGYLLEDGRYVLFEELRGDISVRILDGHNVSENGWWTYEEDNILLSTIIPAERLRDVKKRPENYLAQIVL